MAVGFQMLGELTTSLPTIVAVTIWTQVFGWLNRFTHQLLIVSSNGLWCGCRRHIPNYPRVDMSNPYLFARFDGAVIDAKPWGHGQLSLEHAFPEAPQTEAERDLERLQVSTCSSYTCLSIHVLLLLKVKVDIDVFTFGLEIMKL
eukprot:evm.model.scf_338.3 EVM.evm.TU.scf_338.3   scf_338:51123-51557(+)